MIHEPTMAMIRTPGLGIEFYDRVMDRISARSRRPQGVAVHFAGIRGDEINVITIYRDAIARTDVFADFSGPEIANEQVAGSVRGDVSRSEFEVDRLFLADDLKPITERPLRRDLFAFLHLDDDASTEEYEEAARRSKFPAEWPTGMLLHAACRHGREQVVVDIWNSPELAGEFYASTIQPIAEDVMRGKSPDLLAADRVIRLHALTVTLGPDDPLRAFKRAIARDTG